VGGFTQPSYNGPTAAAAGAFVLSGHSEEPVRPTAVAAVSCLTPVSERGGRAAQSGSLR
jgi:hypothetical protein